MTRRRAIVSYNTHARVARVCRVCYVSQLVSGGTTIKLCAALPLYYTGNSIAAAERQILHKNRGKSCIVVWPARPLLCIGLLPVLGGQVPSVFSGLFNCKVA